MWLLALACTDPLPTGDGGLLGHGALWPYPSAQVMEEGRVRIPEGLLPMVTTPTPVERLDHRTGFSPLQTALVRLDRIDESALPTPSAPQRSGNVQMIDLETGRRVLSFAEVDDGGGSDGRLLMVRPLELMEDGHRIAVVVTTEVAPRPEVFQAVLDGADPIGCPEIGPRTRDLMDELDALGVPRSDVAVAWDFPVDHAKEPLTAMLEQLGTTTEWTWLKIQDDEELADPLYKRLQGTFTVDDFLVDDSLLDLDADGIPQRTGTTEADLYIHIPDSVSEAEPGSVPVVIWGHGLFNNCKNIFADPDDPDHFLEWSDRLEMIVVATTWRGLTRSDLPDVVGAANDLGTFPEISERLHQGVVNHKALVDLVQNGGLMDDPELLGLADPTELYYLGVSAGAIMGGVALATIPELEHGLLHVGGANWSMTFPRSTNWSDFEDLVSIGVEDSTDRQLSYAMTQMYWDPVDPLSWSEELSGRSLLLQEAVGDDEVSNLGTEMLARSAGWPLLEPYALLPEGLEGAEPQAGPVLVQFDPQLADPTNGNQPSDRTGAHREVRKWESAKLQMLRFLDPEDPGVVEHFCGSEVCAADNPVE
ncbi:MAG TPA: hypothetical protein QGF58_05015 [Myxococcota bacterium]|nr:hypothetical protein [Myxococcota bacterium]